MSIIVNKLSEAEKNAFPNKEKEKNCSDDCQPQGGCYHRLGDFHGAKSIIII